MSNVDSTFNDSDETFEPQSHDTTPQISGCSSTVLTGPDDPTPEIEVATEVTSESIHTYKFDLKITVGGEDTFWQVFTHTQFGLSTETYTHTVSVTTPLAPGNSYDIEVFLENPTVVETD